MKRNIILLILIASPLMGQEKIELESVRRREYSIKYIRRRIECKRPVFGLNIGIGGGSIADIIRGVLLQLPSNKELEKSEPPTTGSFVSISFVPEFYLGKQRRVYFYTRLPLYGYIFPAALVRNQLEFGILIGMGGYIKEANKYDPWSVVVNGALGPALSYQNFYNNQSSGISGYASFYLSLDVRYHTQSNYAVQFGINSNLIVGFITQMGFSINTQVGLAF